MFILLCPFYMDSKYKEKILLTAFCLPMFHLCPLVVWLGMIIIVYYVINQIVSKNTLCVHAHFLKKNSKNQNFKKLQSIFSKHTIFSFQYVPQPILKDIWKFQFIISNGCWEMIFLKSGPNGWQARVGSVKKGWQGLS